MFLLSKLMFTAPFYHNFTKNSLNQKIQMVDRRRIFRSIKCTNFQKLLPSIIKSAYAIYPIFIPFLSHFYTFLQNEPGLSNLELFEVQIQHFPINRWVWLFPSWWKMRADCWMHFAKRRIKWNKVQCIQLNQKSKKIGYKDIKSSKIS